MKEPLWMCMGDEGDAVLDTSTVTRPSLPYHLPKIGTSSLHSSLRTLSLVLL